MASCVISRSAEGDSIWCRPLARGRDSPSRGDCPIDGGQVVMFAGLMGRDALARTGGRSPDPIRRRVGRFGRPGRGLRTGGIARAGAGLDLEPRRTVGGSETGGSPDPDRWRAGRCALGRERSRRGSFGAYNSRAKLLPGIVQPEGELRPGSEAIDRSGRLAGGRRSGRSDDLRVAVATIVVVAEAEQTLTGPDRPAG